MKEQLLCAKWVLPISEPAIKDGAVLIADGLIKAVGTAAQLKQDHPAVKADDYGRAIIMPGFVDLHTHLEYSAFRGVCDDLDYSDWKIQLTKKSRRLQKADWLRSARLGAVEAVQSGITTIADITAVGASLQAALEVGLRGYVYYEVMGMNRSQVKERIDEAKSHVEQWREEAVDSKIKIGVAAHSAYAVCPPLLKAVGDWAREEKLQVCLHLAGSRDEHDYIKYGSSALAGPYREVMGWDNLLWQPTGVTPVKYMLQWGIFENDVLAVHCINVTEDDTHILRQHDVAVAHCPRCGAKLGMGIAPLRDFLEHGLRVGLGTDSPASNNTMDVFDEMRVGLLLQRGLSKTTKHTGAESFVRLATLNAAECLGLENSVGSLTPGKLADIIVVDMSHSHQRPLRDPYSALVYTANQENVILTMIEGKIIYQNGELLGVDLERIIQNAEPVQKKLI